MEETCVHLEDVGDATPSSNGCEDWWWCYADELFFEVDGAPPSPSHT